ncbi:hypothetical protein KJZ61_01515 [Candidatus Dependentiae bacterium]|nr:hypothetical protein [Candidatus Dependentiae bacterium]
MISHSFLSKHDQVVAVFYEDQLLLYWMQNNGEGIVLKARKMIPWYYAEIVGGIMYNMPRIGKEITTFLQAYHLTQSPFAVCVEGSAVYEDFLKTANTTLTISDVGKHVSSCVWQANYLCPSVQHHIFWHYVCGIKREVICSFHLLSIMMQCSIDIVTTVTASLLLLYYHHPHMVFRQGDLSIDLERCGSAMEQLFSPETLARYMKFSSDNTPHTALELRAMGAALGVFLSRMAGNG